MKTLKPLLAAILLLLIIWGCADNSNRERAQFRSDSQHTGKYNSWSVTSAPEILWKFKTDGAVISSPVVAEGKMFIGSEDTYLYALDAMSGNIEWKYKSGGAVNSTPAVANGLVLFLSYDGYFYALDMDNGELEWKFRTGGEKKHYVKDYYNGIMKPDFWDFYLSSAVVDGKTVYFGSSDSFLYALDIKSGELKWKHKTEGSIHSTPAIEKNSLVVGAWDSRVYCLDKETGKEKWVYTTGRDTARYVWLGVQGSPAVENGAAFVGSRDGKFYALNVETGDTLWVQDGLRLSWMPSSPAIGKDFVYAGSSDKFSYFCFNKKTGDVKYSTDTKAWTFSSPAIDNEMAYIGSANGRLYGIELGTGDKKWEFETNTIPEDTLLAFNEEGVIDTTKIKTVYEGVTDMPTLSARYKRLFANTGSILSSPTISGGVIYFGSNDGYIYAITNKK